MKKTILLSFLMASMMLSAQNTIYVNTSGSDTNDGRTTGTPVLTFSKAISMVTATTTEVILAAGTYQETAVASINAAGSTVTIKGENAANTIIIAAVGKRILINGALHQGSNNSLTIQDLTFKGAAVSAGSGGAINYTQTSGFKNNLTLDRVIFEGNTVTSAGTVQQNAGALAFFGNNINNASLFSSILRFRIGY